MSKFKVFESKYFHLVDKLKEQVQNTEDSSLKQVQNKKHKLLNKQKFVKVNINKSEETEVKVLNVDLVQETLEDKLEVKPSVVNVDKKKLDNDKP